MMNFYRVQRAHRSRTIGTIVESDSPQDAYLSATGFLKYVGSSEELKEVQVVRGRKSGRGHDVKVGSEPGGSAGVRDEGSNNVGFEDRPRS